MKFDKLYYLINFSGVVFERKIPRTITVRIWGQNTNAQRNTNNKLLRGTGQLISQGMKANRLRVWYIYLFFTTDREGQKPNGQIAIQNATAYSKRYLITVVKDL